MEVNYDELMVANISVIVPAYNVENYIDQCVGSIIRQTIREMEINIIDDASTDSTYEVVRKNYGHLKNVKIIKNERNIGVSECRNLGVKIARGKYVYFMDSDDIILSNGLENLYISAEKLQADIMHANEYYVPVSSEFKNIDGLEIALHREPKYRQDIYRLPLDLTERLISGSVNNDHDMVPWLNLYRRDFLLEKKIIFPSIRYEDLFFSFACYCATDRIWSMPGAFYLYRQRESSFMHNRDSSRLKQSVEALFIGDRYIQEVASRFINPPKEKLVNRVRRNLFKIIWSIILDFYSGTGVVSKDNLMAVQKAMEPILGQDAFLVSTIFHFAAENSKQLENCKKMSEVLISVVMPVYNAERYLRTSLDSVLGQTFKDFELICVDDGSTDHSSEILNEYAGKDQRVKVIKQANLHVGVARNRGLSLAKGKYVIFLDADDIFAPDLFKSLFERAEETKADICFCGANMFDDKTGNTLGVIGINLEPAFSSREVFSRVDSQKEFFKCTCPAPWNKLYRKKFLDKTEIRFPDFNTAEDLYFYACTLASAERISCVKKYLINYRCNSEVSLDGSAYKYPYDFLNSLLAIRKWLLDNNIFASLKDDYEKMAIAHCVRNLRLLHKAMPRNEFDELLAKVNEREKEIGVSFKFD